MVKCKHFLNSAERVLRERGPLSLRDIIPHLRNARGIRMTLIPSISQMGSVITRDKRFVKVAITRTHAIWGLEDEDED